MELAIATGAAALAAALAWLAVSRQHLLYREPEYRAEPLSGRRKRVYQALAAAAAALMTWLAFRPGHYDPGPALLTAAFCLVFVVLSSTDVERRRLPNMLTYPAIAAAAAFCWAWPDRSVADNALGAAIAVAIAVVLVLLGELARFVLRVKATAFGIGDAKLILLIGLLLGWPALLPALFLGILAAGLFSFAMIFRGRGKNVFSYGPFLMLGASVALLFPDAFV